MAEIGRLLSLPPPALPGRPGAIQVAGSNPAAAEARAEPGRQVAATRDATEESSGEPSARAKQFRFRVYDGGRQQGPADEALAGERAGSGQVTREGQASREGSATRAGGASTAGSGNRGAIPPGSFSAPFLAQLIAQEQLQPGLYDPPLRAADRAYRPAGGEPALSDAGTARFRMAV